MNRDCACEESGSRASSGREQKDERTNERTNERRFQLPSGRPHRNYKQQVNPPPKPGNTQQQQQQQQTGRARLCLEPIGRYSTARAFLNRLTRLKDFLLHRLCPWLHVPCRSDSFFFFPFRLHFLLVGETAIHFPSTVTWPSRVRRERWPVA